MAEVFMNHKERCKNDGFLNYTAKMWATFPYLWGDFYASISFLRGSNILKREGYLPLCSTFVLENDFTL